MEESFYDLLFTLNIILYKVRGFKSIYEICCKHFDRKIQCKESAKNIKDVKFMLYLEDGLFVVEVESICKKYNSCVLIYRFKEILIFLPINTNNNNGTGNWSGMRYEMYHLFELTSNNTTLESILNEMFELRFNNIIQPFEFGNDSNCKVNKLV